VLHCLELADGTKQSWHSVIELPPVLLAPLAHHAEGIVRDGARELYVRFDSPIPLIALQRRDVIELARVEAAHVVIGLQATFMDTELAVRADQLFALCVIRPSEEAEEVSGQ
jgi:hypothetical protein